MSERSKKLEFYFNFEIKKTDEKVVQREIQL